MFAILHLFRVTAGVDSRSFAKRDVLLCSAVWLPVTNQCRNCLREAAEYNGAMPFGS
jgi:hypothetical protein